MPITNTTRYLLRHLRSIKARGYRIFKPEGRLTASEYCMHAKVVGHRVRYGLINNYGYAYVVTASGELLDGTWHQFQDGTCSLA